MPTADLTGKTIMIAGGIPGPRGAANISSLMAECSSQKLELEKHGARVVLSVWPAFEPRDAELIALDIAAHPQIDALVIFRSETNIPFRQLTAVALAKKLKDSIPVIVNDWHNQSLPIQAIESSGAKYVAGLVGPEGRLAFAVADAIAERSKSGRAPGGK